MCDKAGDSCLLALKVVPDWFVMSKIIEKPDNAAFSDDDIVFGDIDSNIVRFVSYDIGLNSISLSTNLDNNFDNYDAKTINHVRLTAWYKHKSCQKRYMKN